MMRRRTTPATPQLQDLGIQGWLDLVSGPRGGASSYRTYLATYQALRPAFVARRARLPRRARPPFAETLHRAMRRWPRKNVEHVGGQLWRRRYEGGDAD